MEGVKAVVDPHYFGRFSYELEKAIKQPNKTQFDCVWEKVEDALENAVGKNGRVKLAQDFFSQKNPGCENKIVTEAIWQIKSNYQNFNGSTFETLTDHNGIERSTEIGHQMRMYDGMFEDVTMISPEGFEFKSCLEYWVA